MHDQKEPKQVMITARTTPKTAELEFITGGKRDNLEDYLLLIKTSPTDPEGRDIPIRLLHHLTSSIQHRQYFNGDVVSITVTSK